MPPAGALKHFEPFSTELILVAVGKPPAIPSWKWLGHDSLEIQLQLMVFKLLSSPAYELSTVTYCNILLMFINNHYWDLDFQLQLMVMSHHSQLTIVDFFEPWFFSRINIMINQL